MITLKKISRAATNYKYVFFIFTWIVNFAINLTSRIYYYVREITHIYDTSSIL